MVRVQDRLTRLRIRGDVQLTPLMIDKLLRKVYALPSLEDSSQLGVDAIATDNQIRLFGKLVALNIKKDGDSSV
jgi:hypothetical protein